MPFLTFQAKASFGEGGAHSKGVQHRSTSKQDLGPTQGFLGPIH